MSDFRYSTPIIIPQSSGVDDKSTMDELNYVFNALRTLATQLDAVTGALSPLPSAWPLTTPVQSIIGGNGYKFYAQCSVAIGYGAMVNFFNSTPTTVQARPARANVFTNAAAGFCNNPSGYNAGDWGEFIVGPGINTGISGLTPGNWYFLDPTSVIGQVTATAPSTAGQIYQCCGVALTDKRLLVGALNNWLII